MAVTRRSLSSPPSLRASSKRKTYFLPGLCGFNKATLHGLRSEFLINATGWRKEAMIDALFEVDSAATFNHPSEKSPLHPEELLILCVKARMHFVHAKIEHPESSNHSFVGLANELEFLARRRS